MAAIRMMRAAAVLYVLSLALPAAASAGAIDDLDGVKAGLEAAYAPVPKGSDVPGEENSALAAGGAKRDAAAQGGNPLWMIPLSALTATRDRPLFSASRRPPAPAVEAAAPPPPAPDPAPAPPPPPERPALTLVGTIVSPSTSVAMFKDTATQAVTRLRQGEAASGWLLKTVKLRSVIVEKGEQSAVLALPKPLDTSGEQPSPNPLAFGDRRNRR
jgi:general secretion pathway protein N